MIGDAVSSSLHKPSLAVTHFKMDPVVNLAVKSKTDYVPRKCCITNRLLTSKDHASVQVNVGHVDQFGIFTGENTVYCLSGACRRMGSSDEGLNRLAVNANFMNARILK